MPRLTARFAISVFLSAACMLRAQEPFQSVELLSGTANEGQTVPSIGMPFAMTDWIPETQPTEKKCVAPYYFKDQKITGFRASHWLSGGCVPEYGSITFMPTTGPIVADAAARASTFHRETEVMNPAYYAVVLDRYKEKVEMTGLTRSGILRITFPAGASGNILIHPNSWPKEGFVEVHADKQEIVGYNPVHRAYQGSGKPAGFNGYFVARFSAPFTAHGTWCGNDVHDGLDSQKYGCDGLGAYASFAASGKPLLVKIGTSFTSLDEAARNLDAEQPGWDFDGIRSETQAAWKARLHLIEVEGGSKDERSTFYTALYHASIVPRIASDADGTYNGFAQEGKLHKMESGDYYDDYSAWDTYRALHPLLTIIDPGREQQMVQSLVLKGEQGSYLPIFPCWNNYTSEMIGDHTGAIITDAYVKGLKHFDAVEAYRLMLQNATTTPPLAVYRNGLGRRALDSYIKYGYIPMEDQVLDSFHKGEQVSRTMEYAYDDSNVAIMARALGHSDDAAMLEKHAQSWRNVIDSSTGFARGRHADGTWIEPFDPTKPATFVTESVPWIYNFFVPHDVPGLIQALGGNAKFISNLDGLFSHKLYDQGNEPSHHIPYLYDYAGVPYKAQHALRETMHSLYHPGPAGLPGNDDAGQMSAWYIFSAMGFYPVSPGTPSYAIGSPIFSKVIIHQPNGHDFIITARHQGELNEYIQSQSLNGKPLRGFLLQHSDIVKGGRLSFDMGPKPAAQ